MLPSRTRGRNSLGIQRQPFLQLGIGPFVYLFITKIDVEFVITARFTPIMHRIPIARTLQRPASESSAAVFYESIFLPRGVVTFVFHGMIAYKPFIRPRFEPQAFPIFLFHKTKITISIFTSDQHRTTTTQKHSPCRSPDASGSSSVPRCNPERVLLAWR